MKINLVKWRLMLVTLPIVLVVVGVKVLSVMVFQFHGLISFQEISMVITCAIFLFGFMLAGTLADYKESEKIPAEMATALESIEDTVTLAHGFKGDFDLRAQRIHIAAVTQSIIDYFFHRETEASVYEKINGLSEVALFVENTKMGSTTSWVKREQTNLRKLFARVTVVKRTDFISTGYAFLEILTVVIIGLVLISRFENFLVGIILVSFITQVFVYMLRLIKDIDHPFEYPVSGKVRAADIDLFPLLEYYERAMARTHH